MPIGTTSSEAFLNAFFTGTGITAVADTYVALATVTGLSSSVGTWAASTAVTTGTTSIYVIAGSVTYIFLSGGTFTGGTTGASTPFTATSYAEGAVIADNGGTWTEQTIAIRNGTFTEATGGGYARFTAASTSANWTVAADANHRGKVTNAVTFSYGTVTAILGWCTAAVDMSALTLGNVLFWWTFSAPTYVTQNSTPQLPASGESITIA